MGLFLVIAAVIVLLAVLGGVLIEPLLWLLLIGAVVFLVLGFMRGRGGSRSTV